LQAVLKEMPANKIPKEYGAVFFFRIPETKAVGKPTQGQKAGFKECKTCDYSRVIGSGVFQ